MKAKKKTDGVRSFLPEAAKPAFDAGVAAAEEEPPATMPESGLKAAGVGAPKKPGRPKGYMRPRKPATQTVDEILTDIEKKGGAVIPEMVMLVLRAYRALEATNRAQKTIIAQHIAQIRQLKGAKKK